MCGCDMSREIVCGYHAAQVERAYKLTQELNARHELTNLDRVQLRSARGFLAREGLRAEMAIHQMKLREWDEAHA